MKSNLCLFLFLSFSICFVKMNGFAQSDSITPKIHTPEIGVKTQLGTTLLRDAQVLYLQQGHVKSADIYFEKVTNGKKNWHHAYRLPVVGIAFNITDFGNPTNMGYAFGIVPYVKLHLIKQKHFEFNARLGSGLAFLTKSFDRFINNKNSAIAHPLNADVSINFEPEWKTKYFDLGLGLAFTHYSNGKYKTPNMGFNVPTLSLSCGYKFNQQLPELNKQKVLDEFKKQNFYEFMFSGGAKEIMPAYGPKYFVGNLQFQFRRQFSVKSNLLGIAEVNYSPSYKKSYENWYDTTVNKNTAFRFGLGVGYGLSLDRLMLFIQNGIYVYDKLRYQGLFYHRVAVKYYLDNNIALMFSLRTHWGSADVVELGIGYQFH